FLPDFKSSTSITLKSLSYFVAIIQIYYLWTQLIRLNKCRHSIRTLLIILVQIVVVQQILPILRIPIVEQIRLQIRMPSKMAVQIPTILLQVQLKKRL
ncbi:hypothetical protein, partial [Tenacibaculum maritimum]|uniref:hypothetical protein n=1 Tax=Tenacibaculum maritimum TaxID=107401 RepID=UPI001E5BFD98